MTRRELLRASGRRFEAFAPAMQRPWFAALVWTGVVLACGAVLALGYTVARTWRCGAVVTQLAFLSWAGGWMYAGFWRHRALYRQRYGTLAYQRLASRFLLPALIGGGPIVYFPGLVAGEALLPAALAYAGAGYLLVTTCLIEVRGKEVFWNLDLRTFVYTVFPEHAPMFKTGIFEWLRHPIYSAFIRWVFALALLRNNTSAIACAALGSAGVWCLARLEEDDLQRRDPDYRDYRRRVSAFFVAPPVGFWRFLLRAPR